MRKSILLPNIKNDIDLYNRFKNLLKEEYLESFMTLKDFSNKYDIAETAIKYILENESLKKDVGKYAPQKNPLRHDEIEQKKLNSKIKNYGSYENYKEAVICKVKETKLKRYGDANYVNPKKGIETKIKRYGSLEACQKQASEKYKKTCLEKYGVENIFKDSKYIQKCFENKYGENIINPGQVKEIIEKRETTNLERYGCKSTFSAESVKSKIIETNLKRYGFKNANQNEIVKNKGKATKLKKGYQFYSNELVIDFLKNWKLDRKPTASDLKIYIENKKDKDISLSNVYKLIIKAELEDSFTKKESYLELIVCQFLDENNIKYERHNRQLIAPQELDIFIPEHNLAIEVNDIFTHNSTLGAFGNPPKDLNYHYKKTKSCENVGIRLIHLYEPFILDNHKWSVLKDIILHACKKDKKIYARNTILKIDKAIKYKQFFENNNINGYKKSNTAFMLCDKESNEPLMGYCVGEAFFGKGKYDAEITRGACKLGYTVVGGASKIWKAILNYYSNRGLKETDRPLQSIVYYVDKNYYNGASMTFLKNVVHIKDQPSFWNYFVDVKQLKNRDPKNHSEIKKLEQEGRVLVVGNSGTSVNVWYKD